MGFPETIPTVSKKRKNKISELFQKHKFAKQNIPYIIRNFFKKYSASKEMDFLNFITD